MPTSPTRKLFDATVIVLDVEATGNDPRADRLIELAMRRVRGNTTTGLIEHLLSPGSPLPRHIQSLTGIDNRMLLGRPTFADIADEVALSLSHVVVLGHRVRFDLQIVAEELIRTGRAGSRSICFPDILVLDTIKLASRILGGRRLGLRQLAQQLDVAVSPGDRPHRAAADTQTTLAIFHKLIRHHGSSDPTLGDLVTLQGGPLRWDTNRT
jgi:DNA polymerase III subunit epsilon